MYYIVVKGRCSNYTFICMLGPVPERAVDFCVIYDSTSSTYVYMELWEKNKPVFCCRPGVFSVLEACPTNFKKKRVRFLSARHSFSHCERSTSQCNNAYRCKIGNTNVYMNTLKQKLFILIFITLPPWHTLQSRLMHLREQR